MAKYRRLVVKPEGVTVYYPIDMPREEAIADVERRRAEGTLRNDPEPIDARAAGNYDLADIPATQSEGGSLNITMQPMMPQGFEEEVPGPERYQPQSRGGGPPVGIMPSDSQPRLAGDSLAQGRIVNAMQGLGMEFGDEALGAGAATLDTMLGQEPDQPLGGPPPQHAPTTWSNKYDYYRDRARALDQRMMEERPGESLATRVGASVFTGAAALPKMSGAAIRQFAPQMAERLAAKALPGAKALPSIGDRMVDTAVQGGFAGGISGFGAGGASEGDESGIGNRLVSGLAGGAAGGFLGAVAPPVLSALSGVGRYIGNAAHDLTGLGNPTTRAAEVIAQNAEGAIAPPAFGQAAAPAARIAGQQIGQPVGSVRDLALGDASKGLRDTLGYVARGTGKGAERATKFLEGRQRGDEMRGAAGGGQWVEVLRHIKEAVSGVEVRKAVEAATKSMAKEAKTLYDRARAFGDVTSEEAVNLSQIEQVRSALRRGIAIAKIDGEIAPSFKLPAEGADYLSVGTWHYAKMGLDSMIGRAYSSGDKPMGAALKRLQTRVLDMLDEATGGDGTKLGAYTIARKAYAGKQALLNAAELGRDFLKNGVGVDDVAEHVADLASPLEREFYLAGVAKALADKVRGVVVGANSAEKLFNTPNLQQKLGLALRSEAEYSDFIGRLKVEDKKFKSFMELMGSQTGSRKQVQESMESAISDGGVADTIVAVGSGGGAGAAVGAIRSWLSNVSGGRAALHFRVKEEISRMLTTVDPVEQEEVVAEIYRMANRVLARRRLGRKVKGGALAGTFEAGQGALNLSDKDREVPPEGFTQAKDGKWYAPDPKRKGGFLMWTKH